MNKTSSEPRFDPATRFVLEIGSPVRDEQRLLAILEEGPGWDQVVALAYRHNLSQTLAVVLDENRFRDRLPRDLARRMRGLKRAATYLDRLGVIVLGEIEEAFRGHLPFLLLKGQGLADRYYRSPVERSARDVDLLVPRDAQSDAETLLCELGYRPLNREYYEGSHFHIPFVHQQRSHCGIIELHWDVSPGRSKLNFDVDRWWDRSIVRSLRAGDVRMPSPADELSHLSWHSLNRGAMTLRDLADITRVALEVERESLWGQSLELADRYGATRFIEQSLYLARMLWRLPETVPSTLQVDAPRGRWISRNLLGVNSVVSHGHLLWWPYRQINYWSLLPRHQSGWTDLLRSTLRDVRDENPTRGIGSRLVQDSRVISSLLYALGRCVVARRPGEKNSTTGNTGSD